MLKFGDFVGLDVGSDLRVGLTVVLNEDPRSGWTDLLARGGCRQWIDWMYSTLVLSPNGVDWLSPSKKLFISYLQYTTSH